ncbi:MAG: hypothetical protein WCX31_20790 [Salinivirgaceae bacterium]|jgi:hypothetical protein
MKTLNLNLFVIFLTTFFLLVSCTNNPKQGTTTTKEGSEITVVNQDMKPEIAKILNQFPTPFEVSTLVEKAKAGFIFDLTNPVENLDKYITEQAKALYLGVYGADLSYAAVYNRSEEINILMECTGKLTDDLGMAGIYNEDLVETVKKNYDNKESLVDIFTKVFDDTKSFLSKNNKDKVSVFIVTGSFVETMYLVTSLNMTAKNNQELTKIIYNQEENLDKLLNILGSYSSDEAIKKLAEPLTNFKAFYANNPTKPNENLTPEKAVELKNLVEAARASFAN